MKLVKVAAALGLCLCPALFIGAALAQDAPVARREASMKEIGGALGALTRIVRGQAAYDAEAVRVALTTVSANIKEFPDLFPAGTEAGSRAAPAIWSDNAGFRAEAQKLADDADALLASLPGDQAAVGAALQTIGASCGTCHQTYRISR